jgi:Ca2+-transporting ATPase
MVYTIPDHLKGLTEDELKISREEFGYNQNEKNKQITWLRLLFDVLKEPMLLLLISVAVIYVIVGNYSEAAFMSGAIIIVSMISLFQDNRSKKALVALEKLNEPSSIVVRNGKIHSIPTRELAVGDLCIIEEGKIVNADGHIVHSNDFSVNEASLTGESFSVFKSSETSDKNVYAGTLVVSGLAVFKITEIGTATRLGKIGQSIKNIREEKSPLNKQISRLVRVMAFIGVAIFITVWIFSYLHTKNTLDSLLTGLTLAMSVLPEEIPVAFTTFMAIGAWKLMREGIIIKQSSVVETLGSTTVICTDKTGTITENSMHLKHLYDFKTNRIYPEENFNDHLLTDLISYSMWSSEPVPFDPMEKALHATYQKTQATDERRNFQMEFEYPLEGKPPMMTHIFKNASGDRIIAAKGAPEAILRVSNLSENQKNNVRLQIQNFGQQGFRVLGVARSLFKGGDFPAKQQDFEFEFLGLTAFYDPPKQNIQEVFRKIYSAGIKVKVITGDNADTTNAISKQAGIINNLPPLNGEKLMTFAEDERLKLSANTNLFTRMFPEAKLVVVNALKQNGEIVAMLGDGVNDAPALKSAHIGVAMGTKGTEIAKAAASLVIINDDLQKLIVGIEAGRRIYANIKKAIRYIISIHIPIILTVTIPLLLAWVFPHILTPVHVIFLELIMGPTCSIVYENEPSEKNIMNLKPRKMTDSFINASELTESILQGLIITLGLFLVYHLTTLSGGSEQKTRAVVFTTLILANILLSFVNRSFHYSIIETIQNKNVLLFGVSAIAVALLLAILYIQPLSDFFKVTTLTLLEFSLSAIIAVISVAWFEIYKWIKRRRMLLT